MIEYVRCPVPVPVPVLSIFEKYLPLIFTVNFGEASAFRAVKL